MTPRLSQTLKERVDKVLVAVQQAAVARRPHESRRIDEAFALVRGEVTADADALSGLLESTTLPTEPSEASARICMVLRGSYVCTQAPGHRGLHIASGAEAGVMAAWHSDGGPTLTCDSEESAPVPSSSEPSEVDELIAWAKTEGDKWVEWAPNSPVDELTFAFIGNGAKLRRIAALLSTLQPRAKCGVCNALTSNAAEPTDSGQMEPTCDSCLRDLAEPTDEQVAREMANEWGIEAAEQASSMWREARERLRVVPGSPNKPSGEKV